MRDDNLNAFIGFRYAPEDRVVAKQAVRVLPAFEIFERRGLGDMWNSVFSRKDSLTETIRTGDFPNLAIHFPDIVLGAADYCLSLPQGRTHGQPAFFSPSDECGSLDDCDCSAYFKRFLSSCPRISADESAG